MKLQCKGILAFTYFDKGAPLTLLSCCQWWSCSLQSRPACWLCECAAGGGVEVNVVWQLLHLQGQVVLSADIFPGVPLLQLGSVSYSTASLEEDQRYRVLNRRFGLFVWACLWRGEGLLMVFVAGSILSNAHLTGFGRERVQEQSV